MAAPEIYTTGSREPEEGSSSNKVTASRTTLDSPVEFVTCHLQLVTSYNTFMFVIPISNDAPLLRKVSCIITLFTSWITLLRMLFLVIRLDLEELRSKWTQLVTFEVYITTAVVIVADYAVLLLVNGRYIRIIAIPILMLVFIGALWNKFWMKDRLQNHCKTEKLMTIAVLPYWPLYSVLQLTQFEVKHGDASVIAHFLIFFTTSLGTLARMIARMPVGDKPGVERVLQLLNRTCIVLALIIAHSVAAEWLGEDIVLVCMPELIAVLILFIIYFDRGGYTMTIDNVTSFKSGVFVLSMVVVVMGCLTSLYAYEEEILFSWHKRVLFACGTSGGLSYFGVWMLHQWPGSTPDLLEGAIKLLSFSANISLITIAMLLVLMLLYGAIPI